MHTWVRFDETSQPDKEAFYNEFNLEDITDQDYDHAQKVFKELGLKNLGFRGGELGAEYVMQYIGMLKQIINT